MNASAILRAQGWRGEGHSLHPTDDSTGLRHHLLARRQGSDGRGLGANKDHKAEAWWASAFDQALKGIEVAGGPRQTVAQHTLALSKITAKGAAKYTGSRGLYGSFVSAGLLGGSIGVDGKNGEERRGRGGETGMLTPPDSGAGTPAAIEGVELGKAERKEEKKRTKKRKEEKRTMKEKELQTETVAETDKKAKKAERKRAKEALKAGETREQRKARRAERRARKEERRKRRISKGLADT